MRWNGETALPAPIVLEGGENFSIPSRGTHQIPCRAFFPSAYRAGDASTSKGTFMHIHGGGWVLFDERTSDVLMKFYAETTGCVIVSIGYRLAPEDPWPKGVEDVEDAGEWMRRNERGWGELRYIGGEVSGLNSFCRAAFLYLPRGRVRGGKGEWRRESRRAQHTRNDEPS